MRRLLGFLAAVVIASSALADNGPVTYQNSAITAGTTLCFPTRTPAGQVVIDSTGSKFRCDAGTGRFFYADAPPCPSNPPSAVACTASSILRQCARTDNGDVWGCAGPSGFMVNKSGSGGSSSGAAGSIQVSAGSGAFGTVPGLTGDSSTGAVGTKILNTVIHAYKYATAGAGTDASPFTTSGSTTLTTALAACGTVGCTVDLDDYVYDLGSTTVTIPKTTTSTDKRFYKIIGRGARLTYSGTGDAIEYQQDHTGTPGSSIQNNFGIELAGFTISHVGGTARTGTAIAINYGTLWNIHDVELGTRKEDRVAGDNGFAYGIKFAERSGSYQTVDDFMTIERCRFSGNTHALYSGQQADSLTLRDNYFEANPNVAAAQDGAEIRNTQGLDISGNTFNFFGFNSSMFALRLVGTINSASVRANYFEGNATAIRLDTQLRMNGIGIRDNFISIKNQSGSYGIYAGNTSGTYALRALTVANNTISGIETGTVGIMLREDVEDAHIGPNGYESNGLQNLLTIVTGATTTGASVIIEECIQPNVSAVGNVNAGAACVPAIRALHNTQDFPAFRAENTSSTAGNSPWYQAVSGGASHLGYSWYVDSSGSFHWYNGSDRASLSAAGLFTSAAMLPTTRFAPPNSTTLPVTCAIGDEYFDTDATAGQNKYGCTSTNTWTLEGDGGGAFQANGSTVPNPNLASGPKVSFGVVGSNITPGIVAGSLLDADINPSAGINWSKLGAVASSVIAGKVSDKVGSGFLVFNNGPQLISPVVQTANISKCAHYDAAGVLGPATQDCPNGGGGTVASVGLSLPSLFIVTNSPVTASGTLTGVLASQAPGLFLAGPTSGSPAAPTMRVLSALDCASAQFNGTAGTTGCVPAPTSGDISSGYFLKANGAWAAAAGLATTGTPAQFQVARFGAGGTTLNGLSTVTFDDSGNHSATSYTAADPGNGSRKVTFRNNWSADPAAPTTRFSYIYMKGGADPGDDALPYFRNLTNGVVKILNGVGGDYGDFTCSGGTCAVDAGAITGGKIALASQASFDLMYNNAGTWTRIPNGTTGQVLNATTGAAPSWGSPTGTTNNATFVMNAIATGDTGIVHIPSASTITRVACYTVGGATSVATVNVNKRAQATPATSGTDVTTTAYTCDTTTVNTAQTVNSAAVTAGNWLALTFGTVTGTANLVVSVDYTTP